MEVVFQLFDAEMWYMIREKLGSGMSVSDIAKEMGMSRPTVRKYLKAKRPPEYEKKNRVLYCFSQFRANVENN